MRKIFISYRRAEAEYAAGALGRELRSYFGEEQVFRDKEDIGGGASWKQTVLHEIDRDSALLVLIGKDWSNAKDAQGRRRLENDDDPIRLEIADGIHDGAAVIPILLENAQMPSENELPPEMRPMAEMNALKLRDGDWQYDLEHICKTLEKAGFQPRARATGSGDRRTPPQETPGKPAQRGVPIKLIASYVIGVLALIGFSETHDSDTYWGLALFSLIALVLAVLAYRDYQQGRSSSMWPAIGAIALGALGTLGYTGWALDPTPTSKTKAAVEQPAQQPQRLTAEAPNAAAPVAEAPQPAKAISPPPVRLANAPRQLAPAEPAVPPPAARMADISGRWKDSEDDTVIIFTQQGDRVHMVATQQGVAVEGNGALSGRELSMTLTMAGLMFAEMRLTLSPDGRALRGAMVSQGQSEQVLFTR